MKICGWCGKEITDDKYSEIWNNRKLVIRFHHKCLEDEKLRKRLQELLTYGIHH